MSRAIYYPSLQPVLALLGSMIGSAEPAQPPRQDFARIIFGQQPHLDAPPISIMTPQNTCRCT